MKDDHRQQVDPQIDPLSQSSFLTPPMGESRSNRCQQPSSGGSRFFPRRRRIAGRVLIALGALGLMGGLPGSWRVAIAQTPAESSAADPAPPQDADTVPMRRPILREGSQGLPVTQVQALLKLLGYYQDAVDGVYRNSTQVAVAAFQTDAGLEPDGIVGPATWSRLLPSLPVRAPQAETPADAVATSPPADPPVEPTSPPAEASSPASPAPTPTPAPEPAAPDREPETPPDAAAAPTTPAPSVTLPTLRLGMTGPAVEQVQERLRRLGTYQGAIDGIFGEATQAAVIAAQRQAQLEPDGIVGAATWNMLLDIGEESRSPSP